MFLKTLGFLVIFVIFGIARQMSLNSAFSPILVISGEDCHF